MTGFDETVPPDDTDPADDAPANEMDEQGPEHDSKNPALEDEPTEDEPG